MKLAGMLRSAPAALPCCQVLAAGMADGDAYVRKSAVLGAAALVRHQPLAAQQHKLLESVGQMLLVGGRGLVLPDACNAVDGLASVFSTGRRVHGK